MFIEDGDGELVNTAYLRRITKRGHWSRGLGPDGEQIDLAEHIDILRDLLTATVVPAITPLNLVAIYLGGPDEEPLIERSPIIAWRITGGGWPEPIAAGCEAPNSISNGRYFIELPSGRFQQAIYEGGCHNSLEECVAAVVNHERKQYGHALAPVADGVA